MPRPRSGVADLFKKPVGDSLDLQRILKIPRRAPFTADSDRGRALVDLMTERLRRPDRPPGAACGCKTELGREVCVDRLLFAQAWSLYEAPLAGGLLAAVGVGSGKTLLDVLMAMVMPGCKIAVLFIPPGLVEQLKEEYLAIREHFRVPSLIVGDAGGWLVAGAPVVHVIPYSRFSLPESTVAFKTLRPDLIMADEVHNLKNLESVRTARFMGYFAQAEGTRLCAWSGSITSKSIRDFAHLIMLALRENSPLPLDGDTLDDWAGAVDPSDWPAGAGALRALDTSTGDVREALRRRLVETRGFVSTTSNDACPASQPFEERKVKAPAAIRELIKSVRDTGIRPDGEDFLNDALKISDCVKQLACGFYYRWRFPDNPEQRVKDEWFAARKAWRRECRIMLGDRREFLDSPGLLESAAIRAYQTPAYQGELPVWASECYPRWRDIESAVEYETEAVWVDDFIVRDAAAWAAKNLGIVWYEWDALGEAIAAMSGLPMHAGGPKAERLILDEKGNRSIIASIGSHGTGRNGLQFKFANQLVVFPPSDGLAWEQLLGRLHRMGQTADEVRTYVYRHTAEMRDALDRAARYAKYMLGITRNEQKLLTADLPWSVRRG